MTTQLERLWSTDTQRVSGGRMTRTEVEDDVETTTRLEMVWSTDTRRVLDERWTRTDGECRMGV